MLPLERQRPAADASDIQKCFCGVHVYMIFSMVIFKYVMVTIYIYLGLKFLNFHDIIIN